ncbi:MAG TPA: biopolymer transporter ExbD [Caldithrix abyssi]|uniref:Biopolymer transporter ExbD n=1 Tax=Caldithrix abyssi TaxID=187145 RepID=A0A7V5PPR0_CALAY|nr:biopolymer transporter ExbD [Caldithrix abyssi]
MLLGKKRENDVEIPSASLSDIVFLLLIFFLVTTSIDTEKGLDLVLPPPGNQEIKIPKKNITNLLINAAGQVLLDGEVVEISEISRIIKDKLAQNDKLIVSVKTDDKTKYETYIKVLDQLKKAEAKRISLAEPEKE